MNPEKTKQLTGGKIMKLTDLIEGEVYTVYSRQFDVMNKARFICHDTTGLGRDIGYWQFSDRGYSPVNKAILTKSFKDDVYLGTTFAMWGWELNNGTIVTTP